MGHHTAGRVRLGHGREWTVRVAALAACCAAALTLTSNAFASGLGKWMLSTCQTPASTPSGTDGWSAYMVNGPSPGSGASALNCPLTESISSATTVSSGLAAVLEFDPPTGSTIAEAYMGLVAGAEGVTGGPGTDVAVYEPQFKYDDDVVLNCENGQGPCNSDPSTSAFPFDFGDVNGAELVVPPNRGGNIYVASECAGGPPGSSCSEAPRQACSVYTQWVDAQMCLRDLPFTAFAQVDWADILLNSSAVPAATGISGSLLGTAASPAHGTSNLTFTGSDLNGPGVLQAVVTIDGKLIWSGPSSTSMATCGSTVNDPSGSGALVFTSAQPCPASGAFSVTYDTTHLSDGTHELKVILEDAAQTTSTVLDTSIVTHNYTSPSAAAPESQVGATGASGATGGTTPITVVVQPAGATGKVTPPQLSFQLGAATLALARHPVRRAYTHSSLVLGGTVLNTAGTVQSGAKVTVRSRPLSGDGGTVVATIESNGAGEFTIHVPRGDSRLLTLAAGAGTITFKEIVTPIIELNVKRTATSTAEFTGQILIAANGIKPTLTAQAYVPHVGWQTIGVPFSANAKGTFSYTYKANPRAAVIPYRLRVITSQTPEWQSATSPVRTVTL